MKALKQEEKMPYDDAFNLAVEYAKSLGMDVVKHWIYKPNVWTFVCGHSVPQQNGHPYFVVIKDGKAIHPNHYENDEIWFNGHIATKGE